MKYLEKIWTSDLSITVEDDASITEEIVGLIRQSIDMIEGLFPSKHGKFHEQKSSVLQLCKTLVDIDKSGKFTAEELLDFVNYAVPQDFTGVMKGVAIQSIADHLLSHGIEKFTISFGSDVMTIGKPVTLVSKYNPKLRINLQYGCAFTSGNDDAERGPHIKVYDTNPYVVVHVIDDRGFHPVFCDYAATYIYSHLKEAQRWPELKVIGVTQKGETHLLCEGIAPKEPEPEPEVEEEKTEEDE
jgi:hypothetical protein